MLKHRLPSHLPENCLGKWAALGIALVATGLTWAAGTPAWANVPLTRADIEAILNRVELIPRGRSARMARHSDVMVVGDTLRTAAQSQAQLRFNDGSLARVGERAIFQFLPNTRNFRLSNGTMLLLIPPGRGRSTIQTPSAITGIQGSAVVVRHVEARNLTIVMALTNNPAGPMTVTLLGCDGAATTCTTDYPLYAGQMALVQDGQVQILEFDLSTFYDTSPLADGLDLNNPNPSTSLGPALDAVREETLTALSQASTFADTVVLNPDVVAVATDRQNVAPDQWLLSPARVETQLGRRPDLFSPTNSSLMGVPPVLPPLEPLPPTLPTNQPPVVSPPIDQIPVAQPVDQIPVAQPPIPQPPAIAQPPIAAPPTVPPTTEPPVAQPPTGPTVPASPPPFSENPTVPANPPANPPVIFQP